MNPTSGPRTFANSIESSELMSGMSTYNMINTTIVATIDAKRHSFAANTRGTMDDVRRIPGSVALEEVG